MRIAFVIPQVHKRAGTEKCVAWLIEDLQASHDVRVYAASVEDTATGRAAVVRLPVIGRPAALRYLSFFLANTLILGWRRLWRQRPFDIIDATGPDCLFANVISIHYCCAAWREALRQGVVPLPAVTWRQRLRNLHYRFYFWLTSWMERLVYRHGAARAFIAVSEGIKRDVVRHHGVPGDRIVVIPNAVDGAVRLAPEERAASRAAVRQQHGLAEGDLVVLFLAAGDWKRKGLLLVLQALAQIPDQEVKLLVVGEDDLPFYRGQATAMGLDGRVAFCGRTGQVARYYAAADVFVYPSYFEAFALVMLEAAGAGLPLIASRVHGAEELIREGENGLLVEREGRQIAEAILRLRQDPERLRKMADRARVMSLRFDRAEVARRTLEVFARARAGD
ncbi:MAG: glycosyltransferase family 4 protein [Chloroflexi bacterium]|nr:glycosyltransferase family 4 protein [Chloroflexota bacterium]